MKEPSVKADKELYDYVLDQGIKINSTTSTSKIYMKTNIDQLQLHSILSEHYVDELAVEKNRVENSEKQKQEFPEQSIYPTFYLT